MQKLIIFAIFAVSGVLCQDTTKVLQCQHTEATFESVQVITYAGVCDVLPCNFYRDDNVTASITFVNQIDEVDKIVKKINVTFGGATIQYPLPNRDQGCEELQGLTCPLYQGDTVTFSIIMQVLKAYPKIDLDLEFYLEDGNGNVITCFRVTAVVVDKSKRQHIAPWLHHKKLNTI